MRKFKIQYLILKSIKLFYKKQSIEDKLKGWKI